ncbi:MAG: polysaccharide deacetylase family protein [Patescibacteria group bacterium]|jgi:peptidoglycan/xylan/chitin deacetylase (PgdA/CDA1 family)
MIARPVLKYINIVLLVILVGLTLGGAGWFFTKTDKPYRSVSLLPLNNNTNNNWLPVTNTSVSTPEPELMPTPSLQAAGAHVFMYHYVRDDVDKYKDRVGYNLSITPAQLDEQLTWLTEHGYTPITMHELTTGQGTAKSVALTFDDGYNDFYENAYPILKAHNWTATIYVITNYVGDYNHMGWDALTELQQAGFEIGAHTQHHRSLRALAPVRQWQEIRGSKVILEQHLTQPITSFCYPLGSYSTITTTLTSQAGFTNAVTTDPGTITNTTNLFTIPRTRIGPNTSLEKVLLK